MSPTELLVQTQAGLYCPLGAFYIDPVRPVARALVHPCAF
jgi:putative mRNA 3-end processing factor